MKRPWSGLKKLTTSSWISTVLILIHVKQFATRSATLAPSPAFHQETADMIPVYSSTTQASRPHTNNRAREDRLFLRLPEVRSSPILITNLWLTCPENESLLACQRIHAKDRSKFSDNATRRAQPLRLSLKPLIPSLLVEIVIPIIIRSAKLFSLSYGRLSRESDEVCGQCLLSEVDVEDRFQCLELE